MSIVWYLNGEIQTEYNNQAILPFTTDKMFGLQLFKPMRIDESTKETSRHPQFDRFFTPPMIL